MCEKIIKLSLEQARKMYKKSPEMDELLLANFTKEELEKPDLPKEWSDLKFVSGYWISGFSQVKEVSANSTITGNKNTYATKKQARSALAMAQLSQLMKVYNGDWEPDWNSSDQTKFVIKRHGKILEKDDYYYQSFHFLSFKSSDIRDEFLNNFEDLIKQYFMLD